MRYQANYSLHSTLYIKAQPVTEGGHAHGNDSGTGTDTGISLNVPHVQLWQMTGGKITLGCVFDFLVRCKRFNHFLHVCTSTSKYSFPVTEVGRVVGPLVHTQVTPPDFICHNCTTTFVHSSKVNLPAVSLHLHAV